MLINEKADLRQATLSLMQIGRGYLQLFVFLACRLMLARNALMTVRGDQLDRLELLRLVLVIWR